MSFSSEVKNEISRITPEKRCCMTAELAGLLRSAGSIRPEGEGRLGVSLSTSYPFVARHMKRILSEATRENPMVYTTKAPGRYTKNRYEVRLDSSDAAMSLLRETGIVTQEDGLARIGTAIDPSLTHTKCCRKSLVAGFFLGSGTVTNPERGYHFEISVRDDVLAGDLRRVLGAFTDIKAQVVRRGDKFVVYIKQAEQIRDMLGIMGAHASLLKFEESRMMRELRGQANRLSNLDGANIGRLVASVKKQIAAAESLLGNPSAASGAPSRVREAAKLRIRYPEASLNELAKLFDPPVSKSTAYKRLREMEAQASIPQSE